MATDPATVGQARSVAGGAAPVGAPGVGAPAVGAPAVGATAGTVGAARAGLAAAASIVADVDAGRPRIRWTHAWPIVVRPTGAARVHLVHGAGGPLGGDRLTLDVQVGAGAELAVRSAGATLVQPGRSGEPARWDIGATVGPAGAIDWAPEPTVVADGASYATALRVDLGVGARAAVREIVVLGRHGGVGGRCRSHLAVTVDGIPLLAHTTVLDGADPALRGPGGTAGARAVGTLVLVPGDSGDRHDVGPSGGGEEGNLRWAWTELAGPGRALLAVGDPGAVVALLDTAAR